MKAFLKAFIPNKQILLMVGDALIVFFAFNIAYAFRISVYEGQSLTVFFERVSALIPLAVLVHIIVFYIFELYELEFPIESRNQFLWIVFSVMLATMLIVFLLYLFPQHYMGRVVMAMHIGLLVSLMYLWRKSFYCLINNNEFKKNLIWLNLNGNHPSSATPLLNELPMDYNGVGVITGYKDNPGTIILNSARTYPDLQSLIQENQIQTIVMSENPKTAPNLKNQLIDFKFRGIEIFDYPTFYQKVYAKVPVMDIRGSYFLFSRQDKSFQPYIYLKVKRLIDIVLASMGLILTSPALLLACIAIKISSAGPIFFRQERLGLKEKPFILIKFRTMIQDAERHCGPKWACEKDPRITPVGRFLRKTRLDELPQLLNVLKGEMSFVGPRPIRKHFADILAQKFPFYRLRFTVKPGITGWAQVKGDYAGSVEGQLNKLEYELYYIQNQSIFMDMLIILKTCQTVLFSRGE